MTPKSGNNEGPKKKHYNRIQSMLNDGDIDEILDLLSEDLGPRKAIWTVTSFRDTSFLQYENVLSKILENQSNPNKNPILIYLMTQELFFKALLFDFNKYLQVLNQFPTASIVETVKEIHQETRDQQISFGIDAKKAKNVFLCYFESYEKILKTINRIAAVASNDPKWNSNKLPIHYLEISMNGRYKKLIPDQRQRSIRNALTHRDAIKQKDGKFLLTDRNEKKKILSVKTLDAELNFIAVRTNLAIEGMSLPGAIHYELVRIALLNSDK